MKNGYKIKAPFVSVIMPAYNGEKYIGEAIESILGQTYQDFELIIIDDASSDRTLEVINQYSDVRIKLFKNNENKGIAYTTNKGMNNSKGKYIALMDHDDIAFPERIELQVRYMEAHPDIDILGGRSVDIDENGEIISKFAVPHYNPRYIKAMLLIQCVDFRNGTAMIRKDFIKKTGLVYKNNYFGMQDYRFYMEASKIGKISTISNYLLKWRLHGRNETVLQMNENNQIRAEKYREIQRDSLDYSGFKLDDTERELLFKVYSETRTGCNSFDELEGLFAITKKILYQGADMNVDYEIELEHYLKTRLCEQLMHINYFGA